MDERQDAADTLYHGTSAANWDRIRDGGAMVPEPYGHQHVSLTRDPHVARYFAQLAVGRHEGAPTTPVILSVLRSDLEREGLTASPFSDGVWGDGGCDWELEEAVTGPIPARLFRPVDLAGYEHALSAEEIMAMRRTGDEPSPL